MKLEFSIRLMLASGLIAGATALGAASPQPVPVEDLTLVSETVAVAAVVVSPAPHGGFHGGHHGGHHGGFHGGHHGGFHGGHHGGFHGGHHGGFHGGHHGGHHGGFHGGHHGGHQPGFHGGHGGHHHGLTIGAFDAESQLPSPVVKLASNG